MIITVLLGPTLDPLDNKTWQCDHTQGKYKPNHKDYLDSSLPEIIFETIHLKG